MLKPEAATIGLFVVLVIVLLQRNFLLAPSIGPGLTFDNDLYKFLRDFFKHEYLQGTSCIKEHSVTLLLIRETDAASNNSEH